MIDQLNKGLKGAGTTKQFTDSVAQTGERFYEKLTFKGHEALELMVRRQDRDIGPGRQDGCDAHAGADMAELGSGRRGWPASCEEMIGGAVGAMLERDPARVEANRNAVTASDLRVSATSAGSSASDFRLCITSSTAGPSICISGIRCCITLAISCARSGCTGAGCAWG